MSNKSNFDFYIDEIIEKINSIIGADIKKRSSANSNYGRDLHYVKKAIESFIPQYSNLRIKRNERGLVKMLVDKENNEFDIEQLSDGEKNLIALIGDIARRLTIANHNSENPLSESGKILIDELDLHLHPKWQRIVATQITKVFPGCQFIVPTHSPQIISHVKKESIIVIQNLGGKINQNYVNQSYGKNTDRILEDIMDENSRPVEVDNEIKIIFRLIQENKLEQAKNKIIELQGNIGEDGELVKANVLIKRMEIIGK